MLFSASEISLDNNKNLNTYENVLIESAADISAAIVACKIILFTKLCEIYHNWYYYNSVCYQSNKQEDIAHYFLHHFKLINATLLFIL